MKKFRFKKSVLFLSLPIIAVFSVLGSSYFVNKSFEDFLEEQFISEVTSDALSLHYSLKDPAAYGIDTDSLYTEGTYLPAWSMEDSTDSANSTIDTSDFIDSAKSTTGTADSTSSANVTKSTNTTSPALDKLKKYPRILLSKEQKLEYDILLQYLTLENSLSQYELYSEPLGISSGAHCQMPILLSEYDFNCEEDIDMYFKILSDLPGYFDGIMRFEAAKADAGLFMSDSLCVDVINQCEDFESSDLLIDSFANRVNELDSLSDSEKTDYIEENNAIVSDLIMPAYTRLASDLTALLGRGRNSLGLYYAVKGCDYYELLTQKYTGSDKSVDDLFEEIADARRENLDAISEYMSKNNVKDSLSDVSDFGSDIKSNPAEVLDYLQTAIKDDFPTVDNFCYTVSAVDSSLSEGLAPAFYITPPWDDHSSNKIYVNSASTYPDIQFFTTLAHEGFPGHLYQNVMSYEYGLEPYRCQLGFDGYTEGWASYVEFLSYKYAGQYAGIDDETIDFLQNEAAASLSLYASTDIGVNYYGWDYAAVEDFWADYGINDPDTLLSIMDLVISDPANYLKYYVGYLEIENIKSQKEAQYDDFTLSSFHKTLLDIGPAPFNIIEKYFDDFYSSSCL